MTDFKLLLVGDGRLARHLNNYLRLKKVPLISWSRKEPVGQLKEKAKHSEIALLAVTDSAIMELSLLLPDHLTKIHFSGALHFDECAGIHPLMTFGSELYSEDFYDKIPLVIDQKAKKIEWIKRLPNPKHWISPKDKALYHALCHLSGNYPKLLWENFFSVFEKRLEMPRHFLAPFLEASLTQVLENKTDLLAGPFGRKEIQTIETHKEALSDFPQLTQIYNDFHQLFLKESKNECSRIDSAQREAKNHHGHLL